MSRSATNKRLSACITIESTNVKQSPPTPLKRNKSSSTVSIGFSKKGVQISHKRHSANIGKIHKDEVIEIKEVKEIKEAKIIKESKVIKEVKVEAEEEVVIKNRPSSKIIPRFKQFGKTFCKPTGNTPTSATGKYISPETDCFGASPVEEVSTPFPTNTIETQMENLKLELARKKLLININDIEIVYEKNSPIPHILGRGGFGYVFLGIFQKNLVAIKKFHPSKELDEVFLKEVSNLLLVRGCENVIPLVGVCFEERFIITPKAHKTLEDFVLKRRGLMTRSEALKISHQIAIALRSIHSLEPKVMHRDLTMSNILLHNLPDVKVYLADFGISRSEIDLSSSMHTYSLKGRFLYLPPEIRSGLPYNHKVDVFAFGTLMYEIFSNRPLKSNQQLPLEREALSQFDKDVRKLISRCWKINPEKRPNFVEISKTLQKMCKSKNKIVHRYI